MDETPPHASTGRETFLAVLLSLLLGGAFVLFLNFATGGFILYAIAISLAMALFGLLHYFLWGRSFLRDIARERRELELRDQAEEELRALRRPWERRF